MSSEPRVALSRPVSDEVRKTTCYMCACRCGIDVHIKDGKIRYIEGNRDHPVNQGRALRQGLGRDHAALFAGAARRAAASDRPARLGRIQGNLLGGGARHRVGLALRRARGRSEEARLLHRPRPVAVADRLLGAAVRHAQLFRAWRVLLGQHGRRRHHDHRRGVLGVRRAGLGPDKALHHVRRGRGPRFQPAQDGHRQAQEERRALRFGQSRAHRLFGGRRQLDRHPSGHRRPADPRGRA